jgi:putative hydrolase of the HAD superfamily
MLRRYNTTASGLMHEHGVNPRDFMDFAHAIDMTGFRSDAELDTAIGALPGKKVIFTNGTHAHASRILDAMNLQHHFEGIYDIFDAEHRPKPEPAIYREVVDRFRINTDSAVMIEDMAINLKPAAEMGVTTVLLEHNLDWKNPALTAGHIDYIAADLKTFLRSLA